MNNDTSTKINSQGIVKIHGKDYVTVAERVRQAHEGEKFQGLETEIISHEPVVIKATVNISGITYTGISSANANKMIEKSNPYEVAETSAVGRALGFAGYGLIESIASADEMNKTGFNKDEDYGDALPPGEEEYEAKVCSAHEKPAQMFRGQSKSKFNDDGTPKVYWWHKGDNGQICFGSGFKD